MELTSVLSCSPRTEKTIAGTSSDDLVSFWDAATGVLLKTLEHDAPVISVAYSPDGKTVASASEDGKIQFWGYCNQ